MGGASGHITQIWENIDFTFNDLKDLVIELLNGGITDISEKLDGINILITYKDNKVLIARAPKHLKNFGEEALDINKLKEYLKDRKTVEVVEKVFIETVDDFQNVFDKSKLNLKLLFKEGKNWLNVEILHVDTENIIPYGKNQLRVHCIKEIDENGKTIKILKNDKKLNILIEEIKKIQNKENKKTFLIDKTNLVTINHINPTIQNKIINDIRTLHKLLGNDNNATIEDYIEYKMKDFINEKLSVTPEFLSSLAKRWGREDKTIPINILLKEQDEQIQRWIKLEDKKIKNKVDEILEPIIEIFSMLGIIILRNLNNIAAEDPEKSIEKIKNKLNKSLKHIKKINNKLLIIKYLGYIKRLEKLGGLDSVVPTEGIVFEYKSKLLKLTGSFTPILRIIGFYRFGS